MMRTGGWQWAYRALRLGQLTVAEVERHIEYSGDFEWAADAERGLEAFLLEEADEQEIEENE